MPIPNRASFIKHDLPYNNVNGDNVADNFDDFLDGEFNSVIDRIDVPNDTVPISVWTGTNENGTAASPNCVDWRSPSGLGIVGDSRGGISASSFSNAFNGSCSSLSRLLCFQQ